MENLSHSAKIVCSLAEKLLNFVLALARAFTKWGVPRQQELSFHSSTRSPIVQSYLTRFEGGKMLEMTKWRQCRMGTHPPSLRAKPYLVHEYSSPCNECWELEKPWTWFIFLVIFYLQSVTSDFSITFWQYSSSCFPVTWFNSCSFK